MEVPSKTFLSSSKDWNAWDQRFEYEVMDLGVEDIVLYGMPSVRKPKRPTRREIFKRGDRPSGGSIDTPRSIEPGADSEPQRRGNNFQTPPSSDPDDDIDIPKDATDEYLEEYDLALSYWRDCMDEYEDQEDKLGFLRDYMLETVALNLREKYFDPEGSLLEWYWALEDNVCTDADLEEQ